MIRLIVVNSIGGREDIKEVKLNREDNLTGERSVKESTGIGGET